MVDPTPPPNKRPRVATPSSVPPRASRNLAQPSVRAIRRRSGSVHSTTRRSSRSHCVARGNLTPTNPMSSKYKASNIPPSVMTRRSQKLKRVSYGSGAPAPDSKGSFGPVGQDTLAAMSRSRSSVRWRSSTSTTQSTDDLASAPIEIDPLSPTPAIHPASSIIGTCTSSTTPDSTPITGTPHVDKSHEAFDDSDESLSASRGGHTTVNQLLSPTACKALSRRAVVAGYVDTWVLRSCVLCPWPMTSSGVLKSV